MDSPFPRLRQFEALKTADSYLNTGDRIDIYLEGISAPMILW